MVITNSLFILYLLIFNLKKVWDDYFRRIIFHLILLMEYLIFTSLSIFSHNESKIYYKVNFNFYSHVWSWTLLFFLFTLIYFFHLRIKMIVSPNIIFLIILLRLLVFFIRRVNIYHLREIVLLIYRVSSWHSKASWVNRW